MKTKIYVPDIECDSCVKLISRKLKNVQGISSTKFSDDSVEISYDDGMVKTDHIINTIKDAGYRASTEPFDRKTLGERWKEFRELKHKYDIERTGLSYVVYAFFILAAIEAVAYFGFFSAIPNFFKDYGIWLFYLNLSVVTLGAATWHFLAYKGKVTCMTGMMIGMTFGMQAGMMLGAVIGATNGFFIGSMVGMLVGNAVGIITGKSGGVMGVMQGMMSGLMGGTMGPMISLMMFSDHLLLFMPFYMIINVAILAGFSYMMYEEVVEGKMVEKNPIDFWTFISGCIIFTAVMVTIMILGPKSLLFGGI
ncbi:MAG: heavy metal translocating P-type ATPase [Candidatus Woesearchaeota archaeon]|nr:heavy metal translocating P-type ATPase [Candidatus Woesearchaeota archaeon]